MLVKKENKNIDIVKNIYATNGRDTAGFVWHSH